jgi:hypothetical protein
MANTLMPFLPMIVSGQKLDGAIPALLTLAYDKSQSELAAGRYDADFQEDMHRNIDLLSDRLLSLLRVLRDED